MVTKGPASRAAAHFRGPSSRPGLWRRRQGCPEPRRRPQTPACARQHQGVQQRPSCQRTSSVVSSFTSANCSVSCIAAASADTSACSTSSFLVFLPSRATQGFASEAHAAGARATARTCRCPRRLEPRAPAGAQAPRSGRLSWRSPVQKRREAAARVRSSGGCFRAARQQACTPCAAPWASRRSGEAPRGAATPQQRRAVLNCARTRLSEPCADGDDVVLVAAQRRARVGVQRVELGSQQLRRRAFGAQKRFHLRLRLALRHLWRQRLAGAQARGSGHAACARHVQPRRWRATTRARSAGRGSE